MDLVSIGPVCSRNLIVVKRLIKPQEEETEVLLDGPKDLVVFPVFLREDNSFQTFESLIKFTARITEFRYYPSEVTGLVRGHQRSEAHRVPVCVPQHAKLGCVLCCNKGAGS